VAVIVNFESSQEDLPEYLKSQKNFPIDLGFDDGILPGLNKELIERKVKAGDKIDLQIDLSKILKDDKFKKTSFHFEIISIEEKTKFQLSKEFLDKNGFKTEKDLKDFLVSNMQSQYEQGIKQIEKKNICTLFESRISKLHARKKWIISSISPKGTLVIDDGAKKALVGGKSLLAAGIINLSGKFNKGDHIKILDTKNKEFARGLSSFSSEEINKIMGCHSNEIEKKLGYITKSEVVHKDDMVEV